MPSAIDLDSIPMTQRNCYEAALELSAHLVAIAVAHDAHPGVVLICHGRPIYGGNPADVGPDGRYDHAWVEVPNEQGIIVLDFSHGLRAKALQLDYYTAGSIIESDVRRYDLIDALDMMDKYENYGPWPE